jgi:hypothetical protein
MRGMLLVSVILALFITTISVVLWRRHSGSVVQNRNDETPHLPGKTFDTARYTISST